MVKYLESHVRIDLLLCRNKSRSRWDCKWSKCYQVRRFMTNRRFPRTHSPGVVYGSKRRRRDEIDAIMRLTIRVYEQSREEGWARWRRANNFRLMSTRDEKVWRRISWKTHKERSGIFAQGQKVGIIVWENNNIYRLVIWVVILIRLISSQFLIPFVIIRIDLKEIGGSIVSMPWI